MLLFIRPPEGAVFETSYSKTESLGIEYLCSVLKKANRECEYIDLEFSVFDGKEFASVLRRLNPKFVGLSISYPQALTRLDELLKIVKQEIPSTRIIVGGQYASLVFIELLEKHPEIDYAFRFEAEEYILKLLTALENGEELNTIPNLVFRNNGRILQSPIGKRVTDLDALPFPHRPEGIVEILKMQRRSIGIAASRGCCWGKCEYCSIGHSYVNSKWIPRSAENIAEEVEYISKKYNMKDFIFVDAEFLGPPGLALKRAKEITYSINRKKINVNYSINLRPENVKSEILATLKASGLSLVYIGVESAASSHLHRWGRSTSKEDIKDAVEILEKAEIPYRAGFIMFDPFTTLEDLEENIDFLIKYPIIEPSLLVKGLLLREGVPLTEKYRVKMASHELFDSYFTEEKTALFVGLIRKAIGKLLLFIHRLNDLRSKGKLDFESIHMVEKTSLSFVLPKMKNIIQILKSNNTRQLKEDIKYMQNELLHAIDDFVRRLASSMKSNKGYRNARA